MKNTLILLAIILTFAKSSAQKESIFNSVTVDTILNNKISIRCIAIDGDVVWYAADKGRYGFYDTKNRQKFESKITNGTSEIEFRSIAKSGKYIYALSIGNPALLYQISKDGKQTKLVYQETGEKVFYDSMQFRNDLEGIAVGDPTDDCLSVLITRDGGENWKKIPCTQLPKTADGEAAFAASNTNIVVKGNKTWMVSGGKKARVFYSADNTESWKVYDTPIVQGLAMTGIYTADFYDDNVGFIAGGNYDVLEKNSGNKAITKDGGKTWLLTAENEGFGYASCVQFVPQSKGKQLVSLGVFGLQYSPDAGKTWKKMLPVKNLYTIKFLSRSVAIAAGSSGIYRLQFK